jgi:hypothetical protein
MNVKTITGAMAGIGLVAALFATMIPYASAHECPPEGCVTDGRMNGGGGADVSFNVSHRFNLQCDASDKPQNIRVNWQGNMFRLDNLKWVQCLDKPAISSGMPAADFDLIEGGGKGKYNGEAGASIYFVLTDAGEPGKNDRARLLIRDADGDIVLNISAKLKSGNHQAH